VNIERSSPRSRLRFGVSSSIPDDDPSSRDGEPAGPTQSACGRGQVGQSHFGRRRWAQRSSARGGYDPSAISFSGVAARALDRPAPGGSSTRLIRPASRCTRPRAGRRPSQLERQEARTRFTGSKLYARRLNVRVPCKAGPWPEERGEPWAEVRRSLVTHLRGMLLGTSAVHQQLAPPLDSSSQSARPVRVRSARS
jgi:hypothetical protein